MMTKQFIRWKSADTFLFQSSNDRASVLEMDLQYEAVLAGGTQMNRENANACHRLMICSLIPSNSPSDEIVDMCDRGSIEDNERKSMLDSQ